MTDIIPAITNVFVKGDIYNSFLFFAGGLNANYYVFILFLFLFYFILLDYGSTSISSNNKSVLNCKLGLSMT